MAYSINKILSGLLNGLSERQRDILVGRFGLDRAGKPMTLAALGEKYKITRERVRQIEASALKDLKNRVDKDDGCQAILNKGSKYLADNGGVAAQKTLLAHLESVASGITANQLGLLLEVSAGFYFYPADKNFMAFYYLDKAGLKNAQSFLEQWASMLRGKKGEVLQGRYNAFLQEFIQRKKISSAYASNYLSLSKKMHKNPYGDIGLSEWTEIKPKTIRDRVYVVLKKKKEPLHFRAIARTINKTFAERKPASAPTVHNELIKDQRFVLVGRGIYALAEHGYEPGTAKEVIARILKRQGPLRPREVILAVQKERFFKANTVLVNLQNKSHFSRLDNGTYRVREV